MKSWWAIGQEYYYDYYHADGGCPDQGKVAIGPPVVVTTVGLSLTCW